MALIIYAMANLAGISFLSLFPVSSSLAICLPSLYVLLSARVNFSSYDSQKVRILRSLSLGYSLRTYLYYSVRVQFDDCNRSLKTRLVSKLVIANPTDYLELRRLRVSFRRS